MATSVYQVSHTGQKTSKDNKAKRQMKHPSDTAHKISVPRASPHNNNTIDKIIVISSVSVVPN